MTDYVAGVDLITDSPSDTETDGASFSIQTQGVDVVTASPTDAETDGPSFAVQTAETSVETDSPTDAETDGPSFAVQTGEVDVETDSPETERERLAGGSVVQDGSYAYVIGGIAQPSNICASPDGKYLYIAYMENDNSGYDLNVEVSTDGGLTWGSAVTVVEGLTTYDFPAIACDKYGRVFLVWKGDSNLQYAYSDNYASSFSTPADIVASARYRPAICVTKSNEVHVFAQDGTTTTNYIRHYYTDGQTISWNTSDLDVTDVNPTPISVCIYGDGNSIFVAWGNTTSYYAKWTGSWGSPTLLMTNAGMVSVFSSSRNMDNGHLVYQNANIVYYRTITFSSVTLGDAVSIMSETSYVCTWPTIYEDMHGNLWVFACCTDSGSGGLYYIKYVSKPYGGSWSSKTLAYNGGDSRFPIVMQSTFPRKGQNKGAGQLNYGVMIAFYDITNYKEIVLYKDKTSFLPVKV